MTKGALSVKKIHGRRVNQNKNLKKIIYIFAKKIK